jgi:hypothetical protein
MAMGSRVSPLISGSLSKRAEGKMALAHWSQTWSGADREVGTSPSRPRRPTGKEAFARIGGKAVHRLG